MQADADSSSEPGLRQPDDAPESGDVFTGLELPRDQAPPHPRRDRAGQLFVGEFRATRSPETSARR